MSGLSGSYPLSGEPAVGFSEILSRGLLSAAIVKNEMITTYNKINHVLKKLIRAQNSLPSIFFGQFAVTYALSDLHLSDLSCVMIHSLPSCASLKT